MAVLSISRQFGAGGKTLGSRLAKKLGYEFIDRGIIRKVAEEANVSVDWVVAIERETSGKLLTFIQKMVHPDFIDRHLANVAPDFDEARYIIFLKKVLLDLAEQGNVVLLGRGGQFILPDKPDTYKIFLAADWDDRVKFLEKRYKLPNNKAVELVNREEKKRIGFLSKIDKRHPNDPSAYDICINTSRVSLERAEEMILFLMKDHISST